MVPLAKVHSSNDMTRYNRRPKKWVWSA